jgi:peptide deformylase
MQITIFLLAPITRPSFVSSIISAPFLFLLQQPESVPNAISVSHNVNGFEYSSEWTGTRLEPMALETAAEALREWEMGRWPDPILRSPAEPIDSHSFGTQVLYKVADRLIDTAKFNRAVGLAAQQCGVNASMIYLKLDLPPKDLLLLNPTIIQRSSESKMKVWTEYCLVLPPTFRATLLRDLWIVVEYYDVDGHKIIRRFDGEAARALQHEMDHDRGILTLDHIDFNEMENDTMRRVEREGHYERQKLAFTRYAHEPMDTTLEVFKNEHPSNY